jgi:hypothetical protein
MAPDLFYVTNGWGYGPWGVSLWFDGHSLRNQFWVVALAVVLAVLVRRVVMPVLPLGVPDVGGLGIRQYAAAARHRYPWWITVGSAAVGVASHLVLDAFTHRNGAAVEALPILGQRLFAVAGHGVSTAALLQYGGSALGVVVGVVLLRRLAARGAVAGPEPSPRGKLSPAASALLWVCIGVGIVTGGAYGWSRKTWHTLDLHRRSSSFSVMVMAFAWVAFAGLVVGCLLAGRAGVTNPDRSTPGGGAARRRSSYRAHDPASRSSSGPG